ncbi:MAG: CHAT domain-containing protein [Rhodospirillales bacterium]|nr:CHAT domain-containing protein [Rhodospirillales bacterium]
MSKPNPVALAAKAVTCAFALSLLAGCQPDGRPAVSLQQARQITAEFQGQGFRPPPRTISDIAAILDQQRPDPARVAAAIAKADAEPAANLRGTDLAAFLFERGIAAEELGRANQRVADFRRAYELASAAGAPPATVARYLQQWAIGEQQIGNGRTAFTLHQRRVAAAPSAGARVAAQSNLVGAAVQLGDLATAKAELPRMESALTELRNAPRLPQFVLWGAETFVARSTAAVAMEEGRFAEAERHLRAAIASNDRLIRDEASITRQQNNPPTAYTGLGHIIRSELARALARQGRLLEAEVEMRAVLLGRLGVQGRYAPETVMAIVGLGDILLEQGRHAEALRLGRVAVDSLEQMKIDPASGAYGRALRQIARAQSQQGEWQAAAATYEDLRRRMANNPDVLRAAFDTNAHWGMVSLRGGNAEEARRVLANVVARNVQTLGERHWDTATSRGMLGAAKSRLGDNAGALAEFDAAIPVLLQTSRQSDDEEGGSAGRDSQLRVVFEAAMRSLAASGRAGAAEESFRLADAIRGQGVQRALAQSSARAAAADPALAEFVRQEQDTQKQVGALQGLLTNVLAAPERDDTTVRTLRTQIDQLRAARAAIRQEIERRFPDYVNLIDPRPATVEAIRRSLRPGESLIATYVGQEQTFVWAVPQSGAVAFAATNIGRKAMAQTVADLRKALDPNAASLGDIPAFDVALSNRLYNDLLKPVEAGFANAGSLLVVPHDVLGQLPFAVLVTEPTQLVAEREGDALFSAYKKVPFLVRKAGITQLPSVASLATLRSLPAAPANRKAFAGFGDPWFSAEQMAEAKAEAATQQVAQLTTRGLTTRGIKLVRRNAPATANVDSAELAMLPRLPDTSDEVKGIALALNADASDVFLGAAANERNVKTMDLSNRRVVMFATHGLIPGDLNGLAQPALALSAPNVADIDGDGLLTLDEVLGLRLNADWVVLSACNTATGDGAGAEAVSGLGRAFFYAGTRALLVTNWPVETTSARVLTTDLFGRQAKDPNLARATALQQAMAALIDGAGYVDPASRQTVFAYSHPIFWAPFALVGDGGSGARQTAEAR